MIGGWGAMPEKTIEATFPIFLTVESETIFTATS